MIDEVIHGMGVQVGDGLVQDYFAHAYVDEQGNYVYHKTDVAQANALLDTTPYKMDENGSRGITLTVFTTPDNEVTVKALAVQLSQIGITLEYEQATSTYSEEIKQQNHADFDMIINKVTYNSDKLLMFNARYGVYPATGSVRLFNYSGIVDETLIEMMNEMDSKGTVLNSAFAVSAAFVFGDHLGFTAGFAPQMLPAMIVSKLTGGITAVAVALWLTRKDNP